MLERSAFIQLLDGSVVRLDESMKSLILEALHNMSSKALRCLGFAYKDDLSEFAAYDGEDHPAHKLLLDPSNYSSIESDLIFVGLVGLRVRQPCLFPRLITLHLNSVCALTNVSSVLIAIIVGSSTRRGPQSN